MSAHPLVGLEVIDNATKLRGRIVAVTADSTEVGITWKGRIGVAYFAPTSGRFSVIVPSEAVA